MPMYGDVLNAIIAAAQELTTMQIFKGPMPADESIAIDIGAGGPEHIMPNRSTIESLTIVINGKSRQMATVRGALDAIHQGLSRATQYENNDNFQIYSVETITAPGYAGREPNDQWLFVSSMRVKFYNKGGSANG